MAKWTMDAFGPPDDVNRMIGGHYTFESRARERGAFKADWPDDIIKNEPMLFSTSIDFALKHAGPITRTFMRALPPSWIGDDSVIVDSRVHMLMPGWYPCIPGFHHDDVPRGLPNGQPTYDRPAYKSEHMMGLVNGEICPTVFALGRHELPVVPEGKVVYETWHPIVEEQLRAGTLERHECPTGRLVEFDWQTMHAGQAARVAGWRWFIRLSRKTHRKAMNEIRNQVQVYLDRVNAGW